MAEKGLLPKLSIFAEGVTTNNRYLAQFKKGAFCSLRPVKPYAVKYFSPCIEISYSYMSVVWHVCLLVMNPYTILKLKEFPVFEPNDYFFKHH
jgi:hypothetical protein